MVRNSKSSVAKGDEIGLTSCETYHSRPAKVFLKTREGGRCHLPGHFREVVGEVDCFALSRSFWSWGGQSFRHRHRSGMGLIWGNLKRASAICMSQMNPDEWKFCLTQPHGESAVWTNLQGTGILQDKYEQTYLDDSRLQPRMALIQMAGRVLIRE